MQIPYDRQPVDTDTAAKTCGRFCGWALLLHSLASLAAQLEARLATWGSLLLSATLYYSGEVLSWQLNPNGL